MLDPSCDPLIKFIEAGSERRVWGKLRQYGSESRAEDAAAGPGAEPYVREPSLVMR